MKKTLLLLMVALALFSCQKTDYEQINNETEHSIIDYVSVQEGILTFDNQTSFETFLSKYLALKSEEKSRVLASLGYFSFDEHMAQMHLPFDDMQTEEEFVDYVRENNENLELILNEDQEKEVSIINAPHFIVDQFLNRDKLMKIGDHYNKFIGDYVITSTNEFDLKRIYSEEDILVSDLDFRKITSEYSKGRFSDLNILYNEKIVKNKPWCQNDRSVHFLWTVAEYNTGSSHRELVKGNEVHGKKRGIPCIWYRYNSIWRTENLDFRNNYLAASNHVWILANYESSSAEYKHVEEIEIADYFGSYTTNQNNLGWQDCEWTKERVSVNSQGVGGLWLEIDQ